MEFYDATESAMAPEGHLHRIRDSAAKAAEQAARIAGVLTIVADPQALEIDIDVMTGATELVTWHLNEAVRLADAALLHPGLKKAQALLDWLRGRGAKATLREICHSGPSPLRKKAAADAAIKILEDHRWVSVEKCRPTTITLSEGIQ
jgi:Protein of unknown function (DUF3987)